MSTFASTYRSGYARGSIAAQNKLTSRSKAFEGGAVTSCWLSFRQSVYSGACVVAKYIGVIKESSGNKGVYLGISAVSGNYGKVNVYKYDGTTWTSVAAEAGYSFRGLLNKLDLQIANFGASAHIHVYLDGQESPIIDADVDLSISGVANLDAACIPDTTTVCFYTEIMVADEDTRTFSLVTLAPNAPGDTTEWGGAYTDIDELLCNDADVVYANVVNNIFQCGLTNLPAGSFSVKATKDEIRACKTADATPTGIKLGVRTNGENNHGSSQTVNTAWNTYERLMGQNPVTSDYWTQGEIDALQHSQQAA
jgi:hypothetical protein